MVALHEAEIELLRRIPKRRKKVDHSWMWFNDFSKDHTDLAPASEALKHAQRDSKCFDVQEWGTTGAVEDDVAPVRLASQVDQRRKQIKQLYNRSDLLESLRNELAHFKSGAATTDLSTEEYAVAEMLGHGSKSAKAKKADFMRDMGFPVDRVLKRMAKQPFRYGRW